MDALLASIHRRPALIAILGIAIALIAAACNSPGGGGAPAY
jgi:hypothetical protein